MNSETFANGVVQNWKHNSRYLLTDLSLTHGSTTYLHKQYYYTDSCQNANNGNIVQIIDALNANNSQSFCYDTMNRLVSFVNGDGSWQQTYGYDAWGNMTQAGTLTMSVTYGTNNRITSSGFIYDAAGNLRQVNNGVTTNTYNYDAENRLTTLNNTAATYTYDADGNRTRKNIGSAYTEYVYFNGQPITERSNDGSWADYIFANGMRMAKASSVNATTPVSSTIYYHGDQLNSSRLITDGNGNQVSTYEYFPFGQGPTSTAQNHYLFTGKERDTESGQRLLRSEILRKQHGPIHEP